MVAMWALLETSTATIWQDKCLERRNFRRSPNITQADVAYADPANVQALGIWCIMWPVDLPVTLVYPWNVLTEKQENISIPVNSWYYVVSFASQVRVVRGSCKSRNLLFVGWNMIALDESGQ